MILNSSVFGNFNIGIQKLWTLVKSLNPNFGRNLDAAAQCGFLRKQGFNSRIRFAKKIMVFAFALLRFLVRNKIRFRNRFFAEI